MTTIEKIEKGIITLNEFTEDQQSFIRGIVKLSFNEGLEQTLRIHNVIEQSEQLVCPNCDGEGFSGKGTNEILPCLNCFGSGERVD